MSTLIKKGSKGYVWMLQNKFTGVIRPTYTYASRSSARKATKSSSGRFKDFRPIMITNGQLDKFVKSAKTGKVSTKTKIKTTTTVHSAAKPCTLKTAMTLKSSGGGSRAWFPISKAGTIGK